IARIVGVSIPTVTSNLNRLIQEGVIAESHTMASTGGRKPQAVKFVPDSFFSFGVQISSDHSDNISKVRIILVNLDSKIVHEESFDYSSFTTFDQILNYVKLRLDQITTDNRISRGKVLGVGFSLPGTVDEQKKLLKWAPNIDPKLGMKDFSFKQFEKLFQIPILIENEANAAAYAECMRSAITSTSKNLIYLAVNRGISAGLIVERRIFKGANKMAGELGHMAVSHDGKLCTCGNYDCWELYSGSGSIIRSYNKISSKSVQNSHQFLSILESRDKIALSVWNEYLDYFAQGLRNIILMFDPGSIVIGGEMSVFGDYLVKPLNEKIFQKESLYHDSVCNIYISALKDDASVLGAASLSLQKFYYGKNRTLYLDSDSRSVQSVFLNGLEMSNSQTGAPAELNALLIED
ncbi:MAG: ROK family transcriptional regulator, partial [Spirochaetia bacterium]|nr:ROK family transcriptional regulator [Spirochaetia bacterium]